MSTLQISLAVLGVVLLALIIAYNAWSVRRNAPRRAEPSEEARAADPARQEPGMETVGHGPDLTHTLREPVLGDFGTAPPGAEPVHLQMPEGGNDRFAETDAELARLVALEEQQRQAEPEPEVAERTDAAIQAVTQSASGHGATEGQPAAFAGEPVEPTLTDAPLAIAQPHSSGERRAALS